MCSFCVRNTRTCSTARDGKAFLLQLFLPLLPAFPPPLSAPSPPPPPNLLTPSHLPLKSKQFFKSTEASWCSSEAAGFYSQPHLGSTIKLGLGEEETFPSKNTADSHCLFRSSAVSHKYILPYLLSLVFSQTPETIVF